LVSSWVMVRAGALGMTLLDCVLSAQFSFVVRDLEPSCQSLAVRASPP